MKSINKNPITQYNLAQIEQEWELLNEKQQVELLEYVLDNSDLKKLTLILSLSNQVFPEDLPALIRAAQRKDMPILLCYFDNQVRGNGIDIATNNINRLVYWALEYCLNPIIELDVNQIEKTFIEEIYVHLFSLGYIDTNHKIHSENEMAQPILDKLTESNQSPTEYLVEILRRLFQLNVSNENNNKIKQFYEYYINNDDYIKILSQDKNMIEYFKKEYESDVFVRELQYKSCSELAEIKNLTPELVKESLLNQGLYDACYNRNKDMIEFFIEKGANNNKRGVPHKELNSILIIFKFWHHSNEKIPTINYLINKGFSIPDDDELAHCLKNIEGYHLKKDEVRLMMSLVKDKKMAWKSVINNLIMSQELIESGESINEYKTELLKDELLREELRTRQYDGQYDILKLIISQYENKEEAWIDIMEYEKAAQALSEKTLDELKNYIDKYILENKLQQQLTTQHVASKVKL